MFYKSPIMFKMILAATLLSTSFGVDFDTVCQNEIKSRVLYDDYLQLPKLDFNSSHVKFYLYKKSNRNQRLRLKNSDLDQIDRSLHIEVLIHDWFEGSQETWIYRLKNAYLDCSGVNVITVDYSKYARDFYTVAVKMIEEVGNEIAKFTERVYKNRSVDLEEVHFIGFGLGAHVAGIAGKRVQKLTKGKKVGRISGLDPVGLFFDSKTKKLQKSDAIFVDVIHTNDDWLGLDEQLGQVDFLVNGGNRQPGCIDAKFAKLKFRLFPCAKAYKLMSCSHAKSLEYWIESIERNKFVVNGIVMGEFGSLNAKGSYVIRTHLVPPYGKG